MLGFKDWYILNGEAIVTRNNEELLFKAGQSVNIPLGAAHRIMNPVTGNMTCIEVQTSNYFGEDDIERLEDDFGRT